MDLVPLAAQAAAAQAALPTKTMVHQQYMPLAAQAAVVLAAAVVVVYIGLDTTAVLADQEE